MLLIKKLFGWYFHLNNELADPRIKGYPLMSNPFPMFAIIGFYYYFVTTLGPQIMKNRQPFNIDKLVMVFNISQIVSSAFLVYKFTTVCAFRFSWTCEPIDYGTDWYPMEQVYYSWIYHMIKIMDLLDTVFFVLRKKQGQISFLHLYHHMGMVLATWIGVKFIAGGHGLFVGFANCIVHTCMYSYYLITIWDKKYKDSIWWKKYITQLQMGQFLFLTIMFGQILVQPNCVYPRWVVVGFLPQNIFMLVLFADFYYNAYIKKKPEPAKNKVTMKSELETVTDEKLEQFSSPIQQRIESDDMKTK